MDFSSLGLLALPLGALFVDRLDTRTKFSFKPSKNIGSSLLAQPLSINFAIVIFLSANYVYTYLAIALTRSSFLV